MSAIRRIGACVAVSGIVLSCGVVVAPVRGQCQVAKLTASDMARGDGFGVSDIDGDYIVVGAAGNDDACPSDPDCNSGSAYIFKRIDPGTPSDARDDTWVEQAKLLAPDAERGDWFGSRVAISGDYVLIGSFRDDDANPSDPDCNSGSAYVFRRDGEAWLFDAKLTAADGECGDLFAFDIGLDGNLAVVGAWWHPFVPGGAQGAVYVFRRGETAWTLENKLIPEDENLLYFGHQVSVKGDMIVARATDFTDLGPSGGLRVLIHRYVNDAWTLEATLEPIDPLDGDSFGEDITTDGTVLVAGTPRYAPLPMSTAAESGASAFAGSAHIFRWDGAAWNPEAKVVPSDGGPEDQFGASVRVEGDRILVGAMSHDGLGTDSDSGAAYLFEYNGFNWQQKTKLSKDEVGIEGFFGHAVSLRSQFAFAAGLADDACPGDPACESGATYVYWLGATEACVPIPALSEFALVILCAGLLLAGILRIRKRDSRNRIVGAAFSAVLFYLVASVTVRGELVARPIPEKPGSVEEPGYASLLEVKFRDELQVRAEAGDLSSLVSADLSAVEDVQATYALSFEQIVTLSEETLASLISRAETMSGMEQCDLGGLMRVSGPAEDLEAAANALLELEEIEWVEFVGETEELTCEDTGSPAGDHFAFQTYHGPDPGLNMTFAWSQGARGQNVQFVDIELGLGIHEDLCDINILGNTDCFSGFAHGTAVLGELIALDNDYGCTGLVPDSTAWFAAGSQQVPGITGCLNRTTQMILSALDTINTGDVIVLELQTSDLKPLETSLPTYCATLAATSAGVIVVAAAGNGGHDLDSSSFQWYRSFGDSGANMVGAGTPTAAHDRWCCNYGKRVNLQGWGDDVYTLGGSGSYGNFITHTSAATPFVAAAAIALQSYVEQQYGCRIGPRQMRRLLIDTGICQGDPENGHIGPFPDMQAAIERIDELFGDPQDPVDCNSNQISDLCDVGFVPQTSGPPESADANHNLVPDECEPNNDCNNNQAPDLTDIGTGTSHDCNRNSIPDECDIAAQTSEDCDENGYPDECDTSTECLDGVPPLMDCNANNVSDVCDISSGTSYDCNLTGQSGVPGECEGGKACCDPWTGECVDTLEACCDAMGYLQIVRHVRHRTLPYLQRPGAMMPSVSKRRSSRTPIGIHRNCVPSIINASAATC